jgi:phosphoglycerate dehydrogenase-like enzyme
VEPITRELLNASSELRVIARNGVGVDNVDLEAAEAEGIAVRPAVGANSRGVAELTVGLLFSSARSIPWSNGKMKAKEWRRRPGVELAGRTLGIIGLGHIGRTVAELAASIGMEVIGHDPYPNANWRPPSTFRWMSLDGVVTGSEFLTLHAPGGSEPLMNSERISSMRSASVLVNTARADLVDDNAVLAALDRSALSAYAVDAFATEPPTRWDLAVHDRVIATPHIGGFTAESVERASARAVQAILDELGLG